MNDVSKIGPGALIFVTLQWGMYVYNVDVRVLCKP